LLAYCPYSCMNLFNLSHTKNDNSQWRHARESSIMHNCSQVTTIAPKKQVVYSNYYTPANLPLRVLYSIIDDACANVTCPYPKARTMRPKWLQLLNTRDTSLCHPVIHCAHTFLKDSLSTAHPMAWTCTNRAAWQTWRGMPSSSDASLCVWGIRCANWLVHVHQLPCARGRMGAKY